MATSESEGEKSLKSHNSHELKGQEWPQVISCQVRHPWTHPELKPHGLIWASHGHPWKRTSPQQPQSVFLVVSIVFFRCTQHLFWMPVSVLSPRFWGGNFSSNLTMGPRGAEWVWCKENWENSLAHLWKTYRLASWRFAPSNQKKCQEFSMISRRNDRVEGSHQGHKPVNPKLEKINYLVIACTNSNCTILKTKS